MVELSSRASVPTGQIVLCAKQVSGGRGGLGTFVGVLIFGLLSDILQLQNIDSNVQLLMKGLIIVCTVLVQEQNFGQLIARWRFSRSRGATADQKAAGSYRLSGAAKAQFARQDVGARSRNDQ
jgi:simple sugar transport system permease protein